MQANEHEFIRLIGVYTAGRFDPYDLAGPAKASCRAHCMSALAGKRMPQSKSGVTVLREELFRITGAQGECLAEREQDMLRTLQAAGFELCRSRVYQLAA